MESTTSKESLNQPHLPRQHKQFRIPTPQPESPTWTQKCQAYSHSQLWGLPSPSTKPTPRLHDLGSSNATSPNPSSNNKQLFSTMAQTNKSRKRKRADLRIRSSRMNRLMRIELSWKRCGRGWGAERKLSSRVVLSRLGFVEPAGHRLWLCLGMAVCKEAVNVFIPI